MARSFFSLVAQAAREAERANRTHQRDLERNERAMERAARQQEKEDRRDYLESRAEETAELNQELTERLEALESLLSTALARQIGINWVALTKKVDQSTLCKPTAKPEVRQFAVKRPGIFGRWLPGWRERHESRITDAMARYNHALEKHLTSTQAREMELASRQAEVEMHNNRVAAFRDGYRNGEIEAVCQFIDLIFETTEYPDGFPSHWKIGFQPESRHLVVDFALPTLEQIIPSAERYRYIKTSDEIAEIKRSQKSRHLLYTNVVAQAVLCRLMEIFRAEREGVVAVATINAFVDAIDPATGQRVKPCLVSVRATREEFEQFDLRQVEPIACLKHLKASVSRSPSELVPVRPVFTIDMTDSRFVQETDVLSSLDTRPNLMELSPSEFEHLITNLFSKMGLETKLTQASRDGGVDCVAFDLRPVIGGKVIIQAKRYKNTVGVSAVRDLFGAMQHESASKGILVTTSGYGPAAYEFANGKAIHLIGGSELLSLLKEHAAIEAKIIVPESWTEPLADGAIG